jgi:translation initiation factor 3 subunit B
MHWQSAGDYLCVKMARKKTKKTTVQNFEIFRLKEKNVPVEILEMEDEVIAFAWEPKGHRFALIHGNHLSIIINDGL